MTEAIDTSTLGPIRVEPDAETRRAKIVRDALMALNNEFGGGYAVNLAQNASNATLAKLGRMLK